MCCPLVATEVEPSYIGEGLMKSGGRKGYRVDGRG